MRRESHSNECRKYQIKQDSYYRTSQSILQDFFIYTLTVYMVHSEGIKQVWSSWLCPGVHTIILKLIKLSCVYFFPTTQNIGKFETALHSNRAVYFIHLCTASSIFQLKDTMEKWEENSSTTFEESKILILKLFLKFCNSLLFRLCWFFLKLFLFFFNSFFIQLLSIAVIKNKKNVFWRLPIISYVKNGRAHLSNVTKIKRKHTNLLWIPRPWTNRELNALSWTKQGWKWLK